MTDVCANTTGKKPTRRLRNIKVTKAWLSAQDYSHLSALDAGGWFKELYHRSTLNYLYQWHLDHPDTAGEPVADPDEIDELLARSCNVMPCRDVREAESRGLVALEVNPSVPDEVLATEFMREVNEARRRLAINVKQHGAGRPKGTIPMLDSPARFRTWKKSKILQLADLDHWARQQCYHLTNAQMFDLLFPRQKVADREKRISNCRKHLALLLHHHAQ